MTNPQKTMILRARGDYEDEYRDVYGEDRIVITPTKLQRINKPSREPFINASSNFIIENSPVEEDTAIWAAITAVWNNRHTYETSTALAAAIDTALQAAGYTVLT